MASSRAAERVMSIEQLFNLIEDNASLTAAKSGINAADAGIDAARTAWLPNINAGLSLAYNGNGLIVSRELDEAQWTHIPHLGNSVSLEVEQVVYSGGAIPATVQLAKIGKQQAEAATALTRLQERFLALGMYLDILKINNGIRVYESNILLTRHLIDDITLKHEQGMVLRNDITRYELQLENLRLGLRRLTDSRSIINHRLCNTLRLPQGTVITPDSTLTNDIMQPAMSEAEWQQVALQSSPDIRLSRLAVEQMEQQERLTRSESLPHVALFAADNFNGPITFEVPPINKNINVWYVGVGVNYSISSLFKTGKKLNQARLNTRKQRESCEITSQQVNNAVQEGYTLLEQSYAELDTRRKSVQLAQQNYDVVSERYMNQMALITDMVDAGNIKLDAELQEVDARISILLAHYKMKYLSGTL